MGREKKPTVRGLNVAGKATLQSAQKLRRAKQSARATTLAATEFHTL
jgi:hypothetical protein